MKRILFIEFWNITPHLETSFELAKRHLDSGDEVHYYFCGHDVPYRDGIGIRRDGSFLRSCLPERRYAKLMGSNRFYYYDDVDLPETHFIPPQKINTLDDLRIIKYKECEIGLAAMSSLLFKTKSSSPDLIANSDLINKMLCSGAAVYEFALNVFQRSKPDLIYIFNGRFCNYRSVMNAAAMLKVPYLIHERGAHKGKYVVRPFMPHDFSKIQDEMRHRWSGLLDTDTAKIVAMRFFIDRRSGKEQGWKSFTSHQKPGALPELKKDKRIVVFFSSSDDEFKAVGDIVKWDRWTDQMAALKDLISICHDNDKIQLIIRVHPHISEKSKADQNLWRELGREGNVIYVGAEDVVDTYALIERSDIVVTCGSTVGIEAVYWGTPSICLGPSLYSSLGGVYMPKNRQDLHQLIMSDSLEANPEKALPYGYYLSTFGQEFEYYKAETLFSGKFIGVDAQRPNAICKIYKFMNPAIRQIKKLFSRFKLNNN